MSIETNKENLDFLKADSFFYLFTDYNNRPVMVLNKYGQETHLKNNKYAPNKNI